MNKKEREEIANIFEQAARLIEEECQNFCCNAISAVIADWSETSKAHQVFETLFKKDAQELHGKRGGWFNAPTEYKNTSQLRQRRVLGLTLAALLVREGVVE